MRYAVLADIPVRLLDTGVWQSEDQSLQQMLNAKTEVLKEELSPSKGSPLDWLFTEVLRGLDPSYILQDSEATGQEGVLY